MTKEEEQSLKSANYMTLREAQKEIAIRYGLGTTLVTGHRAVYFDAATELYTNSLTAELQKAREEIEGKEKEVEFWEKEHQALSKQFEIVATEAHHAKNKLSAQSALIEQMNEALNLLNESTDYERLSSDYIEIKAKKALEAYDQLNKK